MSKKQRKSLSHQIKYWKGECCQHMKKLFQATIDTRHITENEIKNLIRALMLKYALPDDEILEQFIRIPFKKHMDIIHISRSQSNLGEPLHIGFSSQCADISVDVWLTEKL